jgi:transcription elongation factor Elf1
MECPACKSKVATLLGALGNRVALRCRACGIDYTVSVDDYRWAQYHEYESERMNEYDASGHWSAHDARTLRGI